MHRAHLNKDLKLRKILRSLDEVVLEQRSKIYLRLCGSIVSQQLSTKVAAVLYHRFLNLYGGKEPTITQILQTPQTSFHSIGFSKAKSAYVHHVCDFFAANRITDRKLAAMSDKEVITLLTQIKGVGRWTAEMILIFTLAREDVFPVDDLGIQNAMIQLYNLTETDKKKRKEKLLSIAEKWSPYRSYASLYLWNWKDSTGARI